MTFFGVDARRLRAITVWNAPLVNSSSGETASLLRSSDFGVMTISGLRNVRTICRRSRWKICAGVVGMHDLHVVVGAQLQEALEARRAVLRAPALRSRAAASARGR